MKEMLAMLNKIVLMGRLTGDPELRSTPSTTPVSSFSIACDRDYAKDGVRETDFFDVVAWQNRAEFVARAFHQRQAYLRGRPVAAALMG
jgi:single-strand DNA-binding protein